MYAEGWGGYGRYDPVGSAPQAAQADAHPTHARAPLRLHDPEPARTHVDRALDLFGTLREIAGAANSHLIHTPIDDRQGRPAVALRCRRR